MSTLTATTALFPSQIRQTVMRLSRRLRQESVGDITPSQLSALSALERSGPTPLGELAELERVAPPSMTRIAGGLERLGLVLRTPDAADRRVVRVAVSESGRRLLKQTRRRRDLYLAVRLQSLSSEEIDALARALPILERLARSEE